MMFLACMWRARAFLAFVLDQEAKVVGSPMMILLAIRPLDAISLAILRTSRLSSLVSMGIGGQMLIPRGLGEFQMLVEASSVRSHPDTTELVGEEVLCLNWTG